MPEEVSPAYRRHYQVPTRFKGGEDKEGGGEVELEPLVKQDAVK